MVEYEGIHAITKSPPDAQSCCEMEQRIVWSRNVLDIKSQSVYGEHEVV